MYVNCLPQNKFVIEFKIHIVRKLFATKLILIKFKIHIVHKLFATKLICNQVQNS